MMRLREGLRLCLSSWCNAENPKRVPKARRRSMYFNLNLKVERRHAIQTNGRTEPSESEAK